MACAGDRAADPIDERALGLVPHRFGQVLETRLEDETREPAGHLG
jgi:hypothetical protein